MDEPDSFLSIFGQRNLVRSLNRLFVPKPLASHVNSCTRPTRLFLSTATILAACAWFGKVTQRRVRNWLTKQCCDGMSRCGRPSALTVRKRFSWEQRTWSWKGRPIDTSCANSSACSDAREHQRTAGPQRGPYGVRRNAPSVESSSPHPSGAMSRFRQPSSCWIVMQAEMMPRPGSRAKPGTAETD